jgi:RimJ/RimL family protein N-acetyltransferase
MGSRPVAEMRIREANLDDAPTLLQFMSDLNEECLPFIYRRECARTLEEERSFVQKLLDAETSTLLVAEAGGGVVGVLDFRAGRHEQRAHAGEFGVSVARNWRRRGIGGALIGELERWAKSRSIRRIELHVFSNNAAAIRLYEKLGFAFEGRQMEAVEVGGSYIDVIGMAKLI